MQFKLIINGVDFSPYIAEGGISSKVIVRQSRDIVTMDGTLHRAQVKKPGWSVQLITLRDVTLQRLTAALSSPAAVEITDCTGDMTARDYYVSGPQYTAKTVRGGNTYYTGVSFELEARQ